MRWLAAIVLAAVVAAPANAEVTRVVVEESGVLGSYESRLYLWVRGAMEGTVARAGGATSRYRVPVTLIYPDRDSNGFGFVDVTNTADVSNWTEENAPLGKRTVSYIGHQLVGDYLRGEGFTYLSVQWSRMVTEVLGAGYGAIENGTDGWEIIKDGARFLRNPSSLQGSLAPRLAPVSRVIGFGYSQGAHLLTELVRRGEHRERTGAPLFDGVLGGGRLSACNVMTDDAMVQVPPDPPIASYLDGAPCKDPLPADVKILWIAPQTDLERGHVTRHETAGYRQYELAGVAHIPADMKGMGPLGATRQNPISIAPIARAMLHNLVEWIAHGKEPPAPLYVQGSFDRNGLLQPAKDADGNALGGVRLPNMATALPGGDRAGAPLGAYGGLDLEGWHNQIRIGGTFEPFPRAELAKRYPTRAGYVDLVRKAAAHLLGGRYILKDDHDTYIRDAEYVWCSKIAAAPAAECGRQEAAR
jgi:hypothetical protein